jgi:hypothetical protein
VGQRRPYEKTRHQSKGHYAARCDRGGEPGQLDGPAQFRVRLRQLKADLLSARPDTRSAIEQAGEHDRVNGSNQHLGAGVEMPNKAADANA